MPAYEYTVRVVTFDPTLKCGQLAHVQLDMDDMRTLGWEALHVRWEEDHCATTWRRRKPVHLGQD